MRPRHNGCHFPDDFLKCIFLNENLWISIKISLNIPSLVQIMAWRRSGDKPLSGPIIGWLNYWRIYASPDLTEFDMEFEQEKCYLRPGWRCTSDFAASVSSENVKVTGTPSRSKSMVGWSKCRQGNFPNICHALRQPATSPGTAIASPPVITGRRCRGRGLTLMAEISLITPADTRCNNNVIVTSKRRRDVVLT